MPAPPTVVVPVTNLPPIVPAVVETNPPAKSELAAPSIIVTSLGDADVDAVFPIIQPPQVAIVGSGAVSSRPWVVDGKVEPRQLIVLSLGADHRVTDGRLGAQFLAGIAERLAAPEKL